MDGTHRISVDLDVPVPMRDGTILRANVYRPVGIAKAPALLTRTPYSKDASEQLAWLDPVASARQGFLVVVQDVRGRYASEGDWEPFKTEAEDGFDTVEWVARLPGSNGRVGMFGASYFGNTQWMAASVGPPSLKAIAPAITWSEPLDGWFARGGAVELGIVLGGAMRLGFHDLARRSREGGQSANSVAALVEDYDQLAVEGYWHLPVGDDKVLARHGIRALGPLSAGSDHAAASACRVTGHGTMPPTPSLQIGGWYDVFCQGTLDNFRASRAAGASAQLIVGPWHHDLSFAGRVGDLNFGSRAAGLGMAQFDGGDLAGLQREWFRRVLDDRSHGAESPGSGVTYFAMGANTWRTAPSWPPPSTRTQRWYLGPSGRLDRDPPGESPAPTAFTYDPDDPVPTHGGAILLGDSFQPGPIDQGAIESRYDVALFTSAPLSSAVDVTGRVRVLLRCRSSAPSTDWVARLCDVHPDGRSLNICDGITRVQRRADALDLIEIDLWSTSNLFLPGHRLRLQITSSCFPRWDRNLNTGDQTTSRRLPALQTVYHDRVRRSWLELEVLED